MSNSMSSSLDDSDVYKYFYDAPRMLDYLVTHGPGDLASIRRFLVCYNEPHRGYHNETHLFKLFAEIRKVKGEVTDDEMFLLYLIAIYHDIIYDPRSKDNEEMSAKYFKKDWEDVDGSNVLSREEMLRVYDAIIDTSGSEPPKEWLSGVFWQLDRAIIDADFPELIKWEQGIFKEYQYVNYMTYLAHRIKFIDENNVNEDMNLINFMNSRCPRIGIYAGSFNPFHVGHMNILEKAERLFDKVIVAIGVNPKKDSGCISHRMKEVQKILPFHEVVGFDGLITDLIEEHSGYGNVTVVRGLRNGYDLNYESNQLRFMQQFRKDSEVVYIQCDKEFEHISSSAIRSLENLTDMDIYKPKKYDYVKAWEFADWEYS